MTFARLAPVRTAEGKPPIIVVRLMRIEIEPQLLENRPCLRPDFNFVPWEFRVDQCFVLNQSLEHSYSDGTSKMVIARPRHSQRLRSRHTCRLMLSCRRP